MTNKFYYQCNDCGKNYETNDVIYLCPDCEKENTTALPPKGILKTYYNYEKIKSEHSKANLFSKLKEKHFIALLPVHNPASFPDLKVGKTPLYCLDSIDGKALPFELYIKDDSQNPTYSFKDRASIMVSAFAKDRKIETIVAASTGNAGSSLAGICATNKQKAIIFVPAKAPKAKLTQIIMYGAKIITVDGTYDNAFDLSIEATKEFGWYNRNTAFNPITIEGKKTVSYEIFSRLNQQIPDYIFVPVGDGVIISGVYKGFEDLLKLGIINKIPVIISVQAEGSNNINSNINAKKFVSVPSQTIADSISVDIPRNYYMAVKFLKEYNGECVTVSDKEIIEASSVISRNYGIFSEPAASAATAGMLKYYSQNKIPKNSKVVVLLTGSGLKDLNSVQSIISIPPALKPNLEELKKIMSNSN